MADKQYFGHQLPESNNIWYQFEIIGKAAKEFQETEYAQFWPRLTTDSMNDYVDTDLLLSGTAAT